MKNNIKILCVICAISLSVDGFAQGQISRHPTKRNVNSKKPSSTQQRKPGSTQGRNQTLKVEISYDGGQYVGEVLYGKPHGQGTVTYPSDDTRKSFEGNWFNGVKDGYGTMIWNDGDKYEGDFKDDQMNGSGTYYWNDGSKYVGNWKDGKRHGKGINYFASDDESNHKSYEGNWENDKMHGYGTMVWNDGDKYEGYWKDDIFDGKGVYTFNDGTQYVGYWENGKEYVDLGLPSGTLWAKNNESGLYDYDSAKNKFFGKIPSEDQWIELKNCCKWTWIGDAYEVEGNTGRAVLLPATGYRRCNGDVVYVDSYGYYWFSTPDVSEDTGYFYFNSSNMSQSTGDKCFGYSIRLVKNK